MTTAKYNKLSRLSVNKTVIFRTPLENDCDLVRTGVIYKDKKSLLHCVYHACSEKYVQSENSIRQKMVEKLFLKVSPNRSKYFLNISMKIFNEFYEYIEKNKEIDNKQLKNVISKIEKDIVKYKIVYEIIKFKDLESIFSEINNLNSIDIVKKNIYDNFLVKLKYNLSKIGELEKNRYDFCLTKNMELIEKILDCVITFISEKYKNKIEIDGKLINKICNIFNVDIYFINYKIRKPYDYEDVQYNGRKSLILLMYGDYDYELIGRIVNQNQIERIFKPDDPIIKDIKRRLKYKTSSSENDSDYISSYDDCVSDDDKKENTS